MWNDEGREEPPRHAAGLAADFADADGRTVRQKADAVLVAVGPEASPRPAVGAALGDRDEARAELLELPAALFGGEIKDDGTCLARFRRLLTTQRRR